MTVIRTGNHAYQSIQELYRPRVKYKRKYPNGITPPQPVPGFLSAVCKRKLKCHTCTSLRCCCKCHTVLKGKGK